jgi:hypothetical protein
MMDSEFSQPLMAESLGISPDDVVNPEELLAPGMSAEEFLEIE